MLSHGKWLHAVPVFAILALVADAGEPTTDTVARVKEYANRREVRLGYSWIMRALVEAKSAVKPLNELYAFLLLGAPDLASSAARGGLAGMGEEAAKKALITVAKDILEHPSEAARRIADREYALGLKAYRENYAIVERTQRGEDLSADDAQRFIENEVQVGKMIAANQLIRDINSQEYDGWRDSASKMAEEAAKAAGGKIAELEGNADVMKFAALAAELRKAVEESRFSLEKYPPYVSYLARATEAEGLRARALTATSVESSKSTTYAAPSVTVTGQKRPVVRALAEVPNVTSLVAGPANSILALGGRTLWRIELSGKKRKLLELPRNERLKNDVFGLTRLSHTQVTVCAPRGYWVYDLNTGHLTAHVLKHDFVPFTGIRWLGSQEKYIYVRRDVQRNREDLWLCDNGSHTNLTFHMDEPRNLGIPSPTATGETMFFIASSAVHRLSGRTWEVRSLKEFREDCFECCPSPDGTRIAVIKWASHERLPYLYVTELKKIRLVPVSTKGHEHALPVWLSDGHSLAFVLESGGSFYNIYVWTKEPAGGVDREQSRIDLAALRTRALASLRRGEGTGALSVDVSSLTGKRAYLLGHDIQYNDGNIKTAFGFEAYYEGEDVTFGACAGKSDAVHVGSVMRVGDGTPSAFVVEDIIDDLPVAYVFLDKDWREKVSGQTTLLWGGEYENSTPFDWSHGRLGVFVHVLVDERERFNMSFTMSKGGVIVGNLPQASEEEAEKKGRLFVKLR